jgi:hypothetical protein
VTPKGILKDLRHDSWLKASRREKTYIILRHFLQYLRIIMSLVAHYNLELHQMDVKTTFLNGDLLENVYMTQPKGFAVKRKRTFGMPYEKIHLWIKESL